MFIKRYNSHQSRKGSSLGFTDGVTVSESGHGAKFVVSPSPLKPWALETYLMLGTYVGFISLAKSLVQFIPLKNLCPLISFTPFFKFPYLLERSAYRICFTKLLAFLNVRASCLRIKWPWELYFSLKDFLIDEHWVVIWEGVNSSKFLVKKNAEGPPVNRLSMPWSVN